jgi:GntR family transcriptional regulator, transcriptional repressor for pyruvate dehydrogenase complex
MNPRSGWTTVPPGRDRGGAFIPLNSLRPVPAGLEPVRKTKVYAEVAAQIQRLISDGRLGPGDRLPPERELAEVFGVSRGSVRDAIRILEAQGLVEARHGEGTVVRQIPIDSIVTPLARALAAGKDETADLFDMRKMLEPPVVRAAALRATDEDVRELEHILDRQAERIAAGEMALEEDRAFHYRLAVAAKNRAVLRTVDVLMDLLLESRVRSLAAEGRARKSLEGHRRIMEAIRRRDADGAAAAMRAHIEEIEMALKRSRSHE